MEKIKKLGYVEYDSNNSGGRWWLEDKDWKALEKAGWEVRWRKALYEKALADGDEYASLIKSDGNDRWLGALATKAIRRGLGLREAVDEWELVTGLSSTDAGCPCCGSPHSFTEYDANDKWMASGPEISYEAHW